MPKCVVMSRGGKPVKVDSNLMRRLHRQAKRAYLENEHKGRQTLLCISKLRYVRRKNSN